MTLNELKKVLYKEKPTAFLHNTNDGEKTYIAEVSDGKSVFFRIPKSEVTDEFKDEVPAQLLIRWIEH